MRTTVVASVVVPTYRRPEALAACLRALDGQTIREALEVIVVDDEPGPAVDAAAVRVLRTSGGRGPAAARNAGARAATAGIVLFVDDDCIPARDWAERLAGRLGDEQVAVGRTVATQPYARATQVVVDRLTVPDAAGHVGFGPTMNLGCRRALLEDVPFDESFPTAAGEDRAWCSAVVGQGIPIAFEERAIVEHRPGLDLAGFVRQHVRYGRGSRRLRGRGGTPFRPQGFYADLARRSFEAGPEVAALVAIAQIATAYGVAREQLSMLRERAGGT